MDRESNHTQLTASEAAFDRVRGTWINPTRFTMQAGDDIAFFRWRFTVGGFNQRIITGDEAFGPLLGKDGFMLAPAESITAQRSEVTAAHQRRVAAM